LNPKAIDNIIIRPNDMYTIRIDMNMLDENNPNSYDENNEYQMWEKYGITKKLVNIVITTKVVKTKKKLSKRCNHINRNHKNYHQCLFFHVLK
jgi:hypothetical protein